MSEPTPRIKSMGLYRNVERILADLAAAGLDGDGPLRVADLVAYDQYHYEGTDAVDVAARRLSVTGDSHVLDVGAGIGGPARYLADRTGCRVTALELQADLDALARRLTSRCGLAERVDHLNGDILTDVARPQRYDGLMSMLCFLHIPDRATLLASCRRSLRPGAPVFVEDYYERAELTESDRTALADHVFCDYLPDLVTYRSQLSNAGFEVEDMIDMTDRWTGFVSDRLTRFRAARPRMIDIHGRETVDGLDLFYSTVVGLFEGGRLGGVRIVARAHAR